VRADPITMLTVLEHLPDGLLDLQAHRLHEVLSGPTLIHLPGRRAQPLFVAVLLHGNETTGWTAVRELLRGRLSAGLPRALSLFIGNVAAARHGRRKLEGQLDHNRVWCPGEGPEHAMTGEVLAQMRARDVFAAVDIHNNTGRNPHYAIVNRLDNRYFRFATMFGRTVVYSVRPDNTCSVAFGRLCPALTLECGQPGADWGVEHVVDFLSGALHAAELPDAPVPEHDMDLFHTVAILKVPQDRSFAFGESEADIRFLPEVDRLNFRELERGTVLARRRPDSGACLEAWDEHERDARDRYLVVEDDEIRLAVPAMPAMLTTQVEIVRMDCVCYLMERLDWRAHAVPD